MTLYCNKNKTYITEELYYTVFRVKKRVILVPCEELKKIQRYLKQAFEWTFPLEMTTVPTAKVHCGKKYVLKMDIKNFYDSVPLEFIEQAVRLACGRIKNADINYYLMISTINGKLPTGAPTSAHIANACFSPIDRRIKNYCRIFGVNYSRFMDDLTFSCDDKFLLNMVEKFVNNTLLNFSYRLNNRKTKYISENKQQNVLGLVVNNNDVRLPKELRKKLRAMIHSYSLCQNSGAKSIDLKFRAWDEHNISQLKGYIAYAKQVDEKSYNKLMKYAKKLNLNLCS